MQRQNSLLVISKYINLPCLFPARKQKLHCVLLVLIVLCELTMPFSSENDNLNSKISSVPTTGDKKIRRKRVIWMKNRKLILPPGSVLTVTPQLQVPFLRQPPEGINSDIKLSWVFYMFFDKLGMTDESHPWPPFYPFSDLFRVIRRQSQIQSVNRTRSQRSILSLPPPERIHGGERAILIPQLEKILESLGVGGRSCLLRAVCEIHEFPLSEEGYGLFGEILTLIFSISHSSYAESHLPEYLNAEKAGKLGQCFKYFDKCSKSIFVWEEKSSKYSEDMQNVRHYTSSRLRNQESDDHINEINVESDTFM